jgi:hypothetical protein
VAVDGAAVGLNVHTDDPAGAVWPEGHGVQVVTTVIVLLLVGQTAP